VVPREFRVEHPDRRHDEHCGHGQQHTGYHPPKGISPPSNAYQEQQAEGDDAHCSRLVSDIAKVKKKHVEYPCRDCEA
jgi:hypothetical protein